MSQGAQATIPVPSGFTNLDDYYNTLNLDQIKSLPYYVLKDKRVSAFETPTNVFQVMYPYARREHELERAHVTQLFQEEEQQQREWQTSHVSSSSSHIPEADPEEETDEEFLVQNIDRSTLQSDASTTTVAADVTHDEDEDPLALQRAQMTEDERRDLANLFAGIDNNRNG